MGGATQTRIKRGVKVIEDMEGEAVRSKICLCLRCARLVTQEDVEPLVEEVSVGGSSVDINYINALRQQRQMRIEELKAAFNCQVAQANFNNCVVGEVAAPITRCPMFLDKARIKPEE